MKKIHGHILIIAVVFGLLLISGSTFAYWKWRSNESTRTNVVFSTGPGFSCSVDGGGNITESDATLIPTNCTNSPYVIKRTITTNVRNTAGGTIYLNLWLKVNNISQELSDSNYFNYVLSNSPDSCTSGVVVASGTFHGKNNTTDNKVDLLIDDRYMTGNNNGTYYLYIWLDTAETNNATQNQQFDFELEGKCSTEGIEGIEGIQYINPPEIVDGLIPVKLSDSGDTVTTVAENDPTWYDYGNKKWANAILVNENTHTRSYYLSNPNTVVPVEDILAYYVWIPRYSYEVWAYSGSDSAGNPKTIPIKFISTNIKDIALKNGDWYTHPAFTFGNAELSGIWVGKFETSHNTLSTSLGADSGDTICNNTECNNYTGLRVLPNVGSLRDNRISNFFYASRFMESTGNPFGLVSSSIDSHMMKNSEWGAIAYLSHSKYGINGEVRINNNSNYTTGCGALNADDSSTSTCNNAYKTVTTYPQSTTGNVTGVFDMSGGAKEYVMAHFEKVGGFFSSSDTLPDSKYYDNYTFSSFSTCTLTTCGGHALNETMNWYSDGASFVYRDTRTPGGEDFFNRGGNHDDGYLATGIFNASNSRRGYSACHCYSFRLVLVAE